MICCQFVLFLIIGTHNTLIVYVNYLFISVYE